MEDGALLVHEEPGFELEIEDFIREDETLPLNTSFTSVDSSAEPVVETASPFEQPLIQAQPTRSIFRLEDIGDLSFLLSEQVLDKVGSNFFSSNVDTTALLDATHAPSTMDENDENCDPVGRAKTLATSHMNELRRLWENECVVSAALRNQLASTQKELEEMRGHHRDAEVYYEARIRKLEDDHEAELMRLRTEISGEAAAALEDARQEALEDQEEQERLFAQQKEQIEDELNKVISGLQAELNAARDEEESLRAEMLRAQSERDHALEEAEMQRHALEALQGKVQAAEEARAMRLMNKVAGRFKNILKQRMERMMHDEAGQAAAAEDGGDPTLTIDKDEAELHLLESLERVHTLEKEVEQVTLKLQAAEDKVTFLQETQQMDAHDIDGSDAPTTTAERMTAEQEQALHDALAEKDEEIRLLTGKLDKAMKRSQDLQLETVLTKWNRAEAVVVNSLASSRRTEDARREEAQSALDEALSELSKLRAENESLKCDLAAADLDTKSLRKRITTVEADSKKKGVELTFVRSVLTSTQQRLKARQQVSGSSNGDGAGAVRGAESVHLEEIEGLVNHNIELTNRNIDLDAKVRALEHDLMTQKEAHQETTEREAEWKATADKLRSTVNKICERERAWIQEGANTAQSVLQMAGGTVSDAAAGQSDLPEGTDVSAHALLVTIREMKASIEREHRRVEDLQGRLADQDKALQAKVKEISLSKDENRRLLAAQHAQVMLDSRAKAAQTRVEAGLDSHSAEVEALRLAAKDLEAELSRLGMEKEEVQRTAHGLSEQNKALEDAVAVRERDLEAAEAARKAIEGAMEKVRLSAVDIRNKHMDEVSQLKDAVRAAENAAAKLRLDVSQKNGKIRDLTAECGALQEKIERAAGSKVAEKLRTLRHFAKAVSAESDEAARQGALHALEEAKPKQEEIVRELEAAHEERDRAMDEARSLREESSHHREEVARMSAELEAARELVHKTQRSIEDLQDAKGDTEGRFMNKLVAERWKATAAVASVERALLKRSTQAAGAAEALSQTEEQLRSMRDTIDRLMEEKERHAAEVRRLEDEVLRLKAEGDDQTNRAMVTERRLAEVQRRAAEEKEALEGTIRDQQYQIDVLNKQADVRESQYQTKVEELDKVRGDLVGMQIKRVTTEAMLKRMRAKYKDEKEFADAAKEDLGEYERRMADEVSTLEMNLQQLQESRTSSTVEIDHLNKMVSGYKLQVEAKEAESEVLRRAADESEGRLSECMRERDGLQRALEEADEKSALYEQTIVSLRNELEVYLAREHASNAEAARRRTSRWGSVAVSSLSSLAQKSKGAAMSSELDTLKTRCSKLQVELKNSNDALGDKSAQVARLGKALADRDTELTNVRRQLERKTTEASAAKLQSVSWKQNANKVKQALKAREDLSATEQALAEEYDDSLHHEIEALKQELKVEVGAEAELRHRIDALESENHGLKTSSEEAARQISSLRASLEHSENRAREESAKIQALTQQLQETQDSADTAAQRAVLNARSLLKDIDQLEERCQVLGGMISDQMEAEARRAKTVAEQLTRAEERYAAAAELVKERDREITVMKKTLRTARMAVAGQKAAEKLASELIKEEAERTADSKRLAAEALGDAGRELEQKAHEKAKASREQLRDARASEMMARRQSTVMESKLQALETAVSLKDAEIQRLKASATATTNVQKRMSMASRRRGSLLSMGAVSNSNVGSVAGSDPEASPVDLSGEVPIDVVTGQGRGARSSMRGLRHSSVGSAGLGVMAEEDSDWAEDLANVQAEVDRVREEYERNQREMEADLTARMEAMAAQLGEMNARENDLLEQIDCLKDNLETREGEISQLEYHLRTVEVDQGLLASTVSKGSAEMLRTAKEMTNLIDKSDAEATVLQHKIDDRDAQISDLNERIHTMEAAARDKQQHIDNLRDEVRQAQHSGRKMVEEREGAIRDLRRDLADRDKQITRAQAQIDSTGRRLEDSERALSEVQARLEEAKDDAQMKMMKVTGEKAGLQNEIRRLEKDREHSLAQLRRENEAQVREMEQLHKDTVDQLMRDAEADLARARATMSEEHTREIATHHEENEREVDRVRAECREQAAVAGRAHGEEVAALNETLSALRSENASLADAHGQELAFVRKEAEEIVRVLDKKVRALEREKLTLEGKVESVKLTMTQRLEEYQLAQLEEEQRVSEREKVLKETYEHTSRMKDAEYKKLLELKDDLAGRLEALLQQTEEKMTQDSYSAAVAHVEDRVRLLDDHRLALKKKDDELEAKLAEERTQHAAHLRSLTDDIEKLREDHHTELRRLESMHTELIAEVQQSHAHALERREQEHRADLQREREERAAEKAASEAAYKEKEVHLQSHHSSLMAALEVKYKTMTIGMEEDYGEIIRQLKADIERLNGEVAAGVAQHNAAADAARSKTNSIIEELKASHRTECKRFAREQEAILAEMEDKHAADLQRMEQLHKDEIYNIKNSHLTELQHIRSVSVQSAARKLSELEEMLRKTEAERVRLESQASGAKEKASKFVSQVEQQGDEQLQEEKKRLQAFFSTELKKEKEKLRAEKRRYELERAQATGKMEMERSRMNEILEEERARMSMVMRKEKERLEMAISQRVASVGNLQDSHAGQLQAHGQDSFDALREEYETALERSAEAVVRAYSSGRTTRQLGVSFRTWAAERRGSSGSSSPVSPATSLNDLAKGRERSTLEKTMFTWGKQTRLEATMRSLRRLQRGLWVPAEDVPRLIHYRVAHYLRAWRLVTRRALLIRTELGRPPTDSMSGVAAPSLRRRRSSVEMVTEARVLAMFKNKVLQERQRRAAGRFRTRHGVARAFSLWRNGISNARKLQSRSRALDHLKMGGIMRGWREGVRVSRLREAILAEKHANLDVLTAIEAERNTAIAEKTHLLAIIQALQESFLELQADSVARVQKAKDELKNTRLEVEEVFEQTIERVAEEKAKDAVDTEKMFEFNQAKFDRIVASIKDKHAREVEMHEESRRILAEEHRAALADAEATSARLTGEVDKLNQRVEQLETALARQSDANARSEEQLRKALADTDALRVQFDEAQASAAQRLQAMESAHTDEIKSMRQKHDEERAALTRDGDSALAKHQAVASEAARRDKDMFEARIHQTTSDLERARNEAADLQQQVNSLRAALKEQELVFDKKSALAAVQKDLDEERLKSAFKGEMSEATAALESRHQNELREAADRHRDAVEKIRQDARQEKARAVAEVEQRISDAEEAMRAREADLQGRIESLVGECQEYEKSKQKMQAQFASQLRVVKESLGHSDLNMATLSARAEEALDRRHSEIVLLKTEVNHLEGALDSARAALHRAENENASLKGSLKDLERLRKEADRAVDNDKTVAELKAEIERLFKANLRLETEASKLGDYLQRAEEDKKRQENRAAALSAEVASLKLTERQKDMLEVDLNHRLREIEQLTTVKDKADSLLKENGLLAGKLDDLKTVSSQRDRLAREKKHVNDILRKNTAELTACTDTQAAQEIQLWSMIHDARDAVRFSDDVGNWGPAARPEGPETSRGVIPGPRPSERKMKQSIDHASEVYHRARLNDTTARLQELQGSVAIELQEEANRRAAGAEELRMAQQRAKEEREGATRKSESQQNALKKVAFATTAYLSDLGEASRSQTERFEQLTGELRHLSTEFNHEMDMEAARGQRARGAAESARLGQEKHMWENILSQTRGDLEAWRGRSASPGPSN